MDTRSKTITIVIIFLLVVGGMFAYAYFKKNELQKDASATPDTDQTTDEQDAGPYANIERIDAKHFFADGTHTLVGAITFPTPCELLNWDVSVAESFPEQVTVDFSVVNESEVCAQALTDQRFSVSFDASEEADISARLEGREVELNLIPPEEGETPEDFELFIKG